LNIYYY